MDSDLAPFLRGEAKAYHRHVQLGVIARGLLQYLAVNAPAAVWASFGSWLRTIREGIPPSERVTALALRNALPDFLARKSEAAPLQKFIIQRIDPGRREGALLVGTKEVGEHLQDDGWPQAAKRLRVQSRAVEEVEEDARPTAHAVRGSGYLV